MKKKSSSPAYAVGYGRPPVATRFKKGKSGNPSGRPAGISARRTAELVLQEIFRPIKIREGDRVRSISGLQVVMRQLVAQAAKGNGPAMRLLVTQALNLGMESASDSEAAISRPITTQERARALAAFINKTQANID
jgi:hypothetical protein